MIWHNFDTITIVEQTIDGNKTISFAHGNVEGDDLVETAERQAKHWSNCRVDRITVLDGTQIPIESQFNIPAGGVSSANGFDIRELFIVRNSLLQGVPTSFIP